MDKVTLSTGVDVALDGDVEELVRKIHEQIVLKRQYRVTFDDVASEISFVVSQLPDEERKRYLFLCLGVLFDQYSRGYLAMRQKQQR